MIEFQTSLNFLWLSSSRMADKLRFYIMGLKDRSLGNTK